MFSVGAVFMVTVANENNHSQSQRRWRRSRPIKTLKKRGKSHVNRVVGKGTLTPDWLCEWRLWFDWLFMTTCCDGCRFRVHWSENVIVKSLCGIKVLLFVFYSQAAMYKKSPPSEADCLLLGLELLYVWRALYTCSETVLNRILSGNVFHSFQPTLCSVHWYVTHVVVKLSRKNIARSIPSVTADLVQYRFI